MIEVLHLFPKLNSLLVDLLEGLSQAKWNSTTVCKKWTVKDIAAHLLDTSLRRLSSGRDNYFSQAHQEVANEDLFKFLNTLNADWVNAYQRISPQVLIKQISAAQTDFHNYLLTLDLNSPALFPVAWAGEQQSETWFDIAREYTERWHHQQQIRLATGSGCLLEPELYHPFLEISMLALPFHYKLKTAEEGVTIKVIVVGDAGGSWTIVRKNNTWEFKNAEGNAGTQVYIDQNIAWMLFSKGIDIFEAKQYWQIFGDYELGFHALKMTAFMV